MFVRREAGSPARNIVRVPDFAGLNGPDDAGLVVLSDYQISRQAERAGELGRF